MIQGVAPAGRTRGCPSSSSDVFSAVLPCLLMWRCSHPDWHDIQFPEELKITVREQNKLFTYLAGPTVTWYMPKDLEQLLGHIGSVSKSPVDLQAGRTRCLRIKQKTEFVCGNTDIGFSHQYHPEVAVRQAGYGLRAALTLWPQAAGSVHHNGVKRALYWLMMGPHHLHRDQHRSIWGE